MSIIRLKDNLTRPVALWATGLFVCACLVVFLSVDIAHKITLPVGILTIASLWLCPWTITLALLFSVIGDYMGSCGQFIGQMGFFAAAHVMYVTYFVKRYYEKVERDRKLSVKAKGYLAMVCFCTIGLLATSIFKIAPMAQENIIRTGVIIYTIVICCMLVMALLQRSSLFALGAILFVFSDFILAWNKFVEAIPHSGYMILVPYFLAQWLLFIRATPYRVAPEMRLMRF